MINEFLVGDTVRVKDDGFGSWAAGKEGVVIKGHCMSSDGIGGSLIQIPGVGVTVIPRCNLILLNRPKKER